MTTFLTHARQYLWAGAAALALCAAGGAQAADVYWSIGVQAPGVVLGMGAPPQVVVAPSPVWGYGPPQAMYGPPAVFYPAPPVYRSSWQPHHHRHWKHERRHDHHEHRYRDNW
jgi:hypothetical protein